MTTWAVKTLILGPLEITPAGWGLAIGIGAASASANYAIDHYGLNPLINEYF